jgi:hypothetical protein
MAAVIVGPRLPSAGPCGPGFPRRGAQLAAKGTASGRALLGNG